MKKRILSLVILSFMMTTFIFTGCTKKDDQKPVTSDNGDTEQTGEFKPEDGAKLKLWMDNDDYNIRIIEAFNKKYPDIEVTVENVSTTDTRGKLELAGPTGEGADVFVAAHDGVAISAESGLILENIEFADKVKEEFMDNAVEAASYNGKLYGFPLTIKTIALFYKTLKDIFPVPAQDCTFDAMNNAFVEGVAPYVITGPWSIKSFTDAGVDFGVTALPKLNGKNPISLSTVDVACVSSFTKYPNASKILADFMASEEGLKIMYETKAELPASKKMQEADFIKADEHLSGVAKQAAYSLPMPFIPEMANVWDPYKKAFTAVWDGLLQPEEALKNAQEEFESSIAK